MDNKTDKSLWQALKWNIENDILRGTYKLGERLPSIRELSTIYGTGLSTLQTAMNELKKENIVVTNGYKGTTVHPFCYDVLMQKHKKVIRDRVQSLIAEADSIGIDREEILK